MNLIRVIPYSQFDARTNMAADEFLLSLPGTTLRFYGWSSPSLSFGRFRHKLDEIDTDFCHHNDIKLVKRLTGGQTVLHQYELTYSIASDINRFSDSIMTTYKMISLPLLEALKKFEIPASMEKQKRIKSRSNICFKEVSSFEIAVGNRKLVGSAQFRSARRFLQHGSILINMDWPLWKKIWKLSPDSSELEKRITHLTNETRQKIEVDELADVIGEKVAESLKCESSVCDFSTDEMTKIETLAGNYMWDIP
jgi:lipoyl(octanoyl) transferase